MLSMNAATIERRLRQRPSKAEVFAIGFSLLLTVGFLWLRWSQGYDLLEGIDLGIFVNAVDGNYEGFYYPNWSIALFALLRLLYFPALIYIVWNALNIAGIWFAARVFGGNAAIAILSYQMLFSLWFGQVVGVIVGGLAFYWWMLHRKQPFIAGFGAVLALIKPQMSIPLLLAMGLIGAKTWRERIVSTGMVVIALVLSLMVWGNWITDLLARMQDNPPMTAGSIALWQYVGAWCLLLWLGLLAPVSKQERLILVAATTSIATPYFIHNGLLALFVLPIGWFGLLGNIGYLMIFMGWTGVKFTAIAPLAVYIWVIGRALWRKRQQQREG